MGIYERVIENLRRGDELSCELTRVFFINAFNAPTPPRSPPDIPSTSSMIKTVLSVILNPATAVD